MEGEGGDSKGKERDMPYPSSPLFTPMVWLCVMFKGREDSCVMTAAYIVTLGTSLVHLMHSCKHQIKTGNRRDWKT